MKQLKELAKYYIENSIINKYYTYKDVVINDVNIDGHLCTIFFIGNEYDYTGKEFLYESEVVETKVNIWEMMAFLYNQSNENND